MTVDLLDPVYTDPDKFLLVLYLLSVRDWS